MKTVAIKSYGKINIALGVYPRGEEEYHQVDMIMVPIELHDSVQVSLLPKANDNFVTIDDFSLGIFGYNLCARAIDAMAKKYNFNHKFRVFIHKNIPMKAGLGGGSSNAVATMQAVKKILKLPVTDDDLREMSAPLGADVPFFVDNKPMRCTGIGEIMTPITIKNDYYVLCVKPTEGIATMDAYHKFDELKCTSSFDIDLVQKALEEGDDDLLEKAMVNSLEEPSFTMVPEIKEVKDKLKAAGLRLVLMTGSGSCVFALSQDKKQLLEIRKQFEDKYWADVFKVIK